MTLLLHRVATRRALSLRPPSTNLSSPTLSCKRQPLQLHKEILLIQTRTKQSASAAANNKKKAISRANIQNVKSNSTIAEGGGSEIDAIFGLRPIDYSIRPPIQYSPPPPPAKPGFQKYLFPLTLLFTAGTVTYFYINNNNDNYEYWKAMQSGEALQMDDEEDDYEDDEEEE